MNGTMESEMVSADFMEDMGCGVVSRDVGAEGDPSPGL
jgi:hypothetical protein